MRNPAQLINQSSGNVEIYTPDFVVNAARTALGGVISLDPASSEAANKRIGAQEYYTSQMDGISMPWDCDTLWMNHPFGRAEEACLPDCQKDHVHHDYRLHGNRAWVNRLIRAWENGEIKRGACCITFAATSEEWFQPLATLPQCYLSPRTNYVVPDGTPYRGVSKGSVVTYLGREPELFHSAFESLGIIKVRYCPA